MPVHDPTLLLFNYDWDRDGFARLGHDHRFEEAGFDLFSFPSNAHLIGFDIDRFVDRLARRAARRRWSAVVSHHDQFGVLAAALLAERLGLPGTPARAVAACQHKLYAREVLQRVCPEANIAWAALPTRYGETVPEGLDYPAFVKPIKASFSVLARTVHNRDELQRHLSFGPWELWVIRHLVEPAERVTRRLLPGVTSSHGVLLEAPLQGEQFNLDGWVWQGRAQAVGVVDEVMYPGTQAFMRFDYPSRLPASVQQRALDVAQRFLAEVGFDHGLFNMEFFYDVASDRLSVIEFNPRLASQLADLYLRVLGIDLHAVSLALAHGRDPASVPRVAPSAGAAASFVFRAFDAGVVPDALSAGTRRRFAGRFPDGLLLDFPKAGHALERDFKWLGSHRHGVLHLGGADAAELRERCVEACALLGRVPPYEDLCAGAFAHAPGTPAARAGLSLQTLRNTL